MNKGSKYRFCGSCIMRHKSNIVWKCKDCDSHLEATRYNFNKLYCSTKCLNKFKYRNRPKKMTFKICKICNVKIVHKVGEWTKHYCPDCKRKFKERWEAEKRCIVCNKETNSKNKGRIYCSHTCRMRAFLILKENA